MYIQETVIIIGMLKIIYLLFYIAFHMNKPDSESEQSDGEYSSAPSLPIIHI